MKEMAACFDIDGVLVDNEIRYKLSLKKVKDLTHSFRRNLFWKYFLSEEALKLDRPRKIGILLLNIARDKGYKIIIFTGRPSRLKIPTLRQLRSFGVHFDEIYFRKDNDFRRDFEIKFEIVRGLLYRYDFKEIHDDEKKVLEILGKYLPGVRLYYHVGETYMLLNL